MNKIIKLTTFFFILPLLARGQDTTNNFQVVKNDILWQKIYQTSMTFEQLIEKVKDSGLFEDIEIGNNKISGDIKPIDADCFGAGYSKLESPTYIADSYFSGFAIISFKEGRYRVTIKRIVATQQYNDACKYNVSSNLESNALNIENNGLSSFFKRGPSIILNYTFTQKFGFNDYHKSEDW
jgi:hypothetical protein